MTALDGVPRFLFDRPAPERGRVLDPDVGQDGDRSYPGRRASAESRGLPGQDP